MMARTTRLALGWFGILAVAPTVAVGVVYQDAGDDAGSLRLGEAYGAVCGVSMDGCGTLIEPRWVLTAAHVARGVSSMAPVVRFGDDEYGIKAVHIHPEGKSDGHRPPRVDLALLELSEPVRGVEPAALCEDGDSVGAVVVIAGLGDVGVGGGKLVRSDGRMRAVRNEVIRAGGRRLVVRFEAPPGGVELEGVGGPGDSGGGMFLADGDGLVIAGVSSASMGGRPGSFGVQDIYTRVSEFVPWVEGVLNGEGDGGAVIGESVDVRGEGIPTDTAAGRCLSALLEAIDSDGDAAVLEFAARYRSAEARRERDDAAWAEQIAGLRDEFGSFEAERVVVSGENKIEAQLRTQKMGMIRMSVSLDGDGNLAGIRIG